MFDGQSQQIDEKKVTNDIAVKMIVTNKLFQIRLVTKFTGKWPRKLDFSKFDEKIEATYSQSLLILFKWESQN